MSRSTADYSVYLVTDPGLLAGRDTIEVISLAIDGGVTVVQYRDKDCTDESYIETGRPIRDLCISRNVTFIVNDRVHLVDDLDADGVHVGQEDASLARARGTLGPDRIIGVSVSTPEEAIAAERGSADYLGISPVFSSPMKTDTPPEVGLAGLRRIRQAVGLPLVAIGSIDASNASEVVRSGADGVAVIRAILGQKNPGEASRELAARVRAGRQERG